MSPRAASKVAGPEGSAKPLPVIGAHVSASGGIWTAIERGTAMEAEAVQLFGSAPQTWRKTNHTAEAFERFRSARSQCDITSAWLHCSYLANMAAPDDAQWEKSIDSVTHALTVAHLAGAEGVVLHTGSHRGRGLDAVLPRVVAAIERILDDTPGDNLLALENAAGQGGVIGSLDDIGTIMRAVGSPRLAVCIDTCHAFAAGHDVATAAGLDALFEEFDEKIGLDRLALMHANDSMMERGSARDRHANIGDGCIGDEGFRAILGHPVVRRVPLLLEVPGAEGKGPDHENVLRLKRLRAEVNG